MGTPPDEPIPAPASEPEAVAPSAAGTISPDGRWVWDGTRWQPAGPAGTVPGYPGAGYGPVIGPAPGLAYAGFWIRLVAYLIDSAIIFAVLFVLSLVMGGFLKTDPTTGVQQVNGAVQAIAILGGIAYIVGFWGTRSATPGQMALGMRIVRADNGAPIDLSRAVIRYVGYVISVIPFGLGLIWAGFDPRKQGWHDKLAGTYVVRPVAQ
ncbi:MAG TPA: RDD family protein [Candidatus Dormibacteraeota bacterium]|jgi:uncharacterized RDD family membrane protein YckC